MAKQNGPFLFNMTIGFVSFYVRQGRGLVRMKSNLTRKRWLKDPLFAGSRKSAANMGMASRMASPFYQWLPHELHKITFFRQLVGLAMKLITLGAQKDEVEQTLALAVIRLKKMLLKPAGSKKKLTTPKVIVNTPLITCLPLMSVELLSAQQPSETVSFPLRRRTGSNALSQHHCHTTYAA